MAPYPLSKDGSCPNCHSTNVAYVLQPRHFAAGTLAPVFRVLLKTHRAIIGLERIMPVSDFPTMMCCGSCTVTPLRVGFNLDWRHTNLQTAFSLTRTMIQDEEKEPVDMRYLTECGERSLQQLHPVIPNSAPVVASKAAESHSTAATSSRPSSLQETIAQTLHSVRRECEQKPTTVPVPLAARHKASSSSKSSTPTRSDRSTSGKGSRWSSSPVQNVCMHVARSSDDQPLPSRLSASTSPPPAQESKWKPFTAFHTADNSKPSSNSQATTGSGVTLHIDDGGNVCREETVVNMSDRDSPGSLTSMENVPAAAAVATAAATVVAAAAAVGSSAHGNVVTTESSTHVTSRPTDNTPHGFNAPMDSGLCETAAESAVVSHSSTQQNVAAVDEDAEGSTGSCSDSDGEPPECPETVSSTVWQFYQQRVLRSKHAKYEKSQPGVLAEDDHSMPSSASAPSDERKVQPGNQCGEPEDMDSNAAGSENWNSVNVQELLQASNEKFLKTFDQRAVQQRLATVRKEARRNRKIHSSSSSSSSSQATEQTRTLRPSAILSVLLQDNSSDGDAGLASHPGTGGMPCADVTEPKTASEEVHVASSSLADGHSTVEILSGEVMDVQTGGADEEISNGQFAAEQNVSAEPSTCTSTGRHLSCEDAGQQSSITASPAVSLQTPAGVHSLQKSYSSFADGGPPLASYPYAAVMAASASQSLASIVPLSRHRAPTVEVSLRPASQANPPISLSNLVTYSSDEEEKSVSDTDEAVATADQILPEWEDDHPIGVPSPSEIEEWQVLDEATDDTDDASADTVPSVMESSQTGSAPASTNGDLSEDSEDADGPVQPVYPTSMTGACPYCYSSDVVYIILWPSNQPRSQLPPLMRNLLLCGCAQKLPPATGGEEVPSFQCRSCGYGFNLNWVATNLEAIFGVNDEPLDVDVGELQEEEGEAVVDASVEGSSGENVEPTSTSDEAGGWDIYWQQLTAQQKAEYESWHATHQAQLDRAAQDTAEATTDCTPQTTQPDSHPPAAESSNEQVGNEAKQLASKSQRQLLAMQPEGVRDFEALLSHIDQCKASLPSSHPQPDAVADNSLPDTSWWQIMAAEQDSASLDGRGTSPALAPNVSTVSPSSPVATTCPQQAPPPPLPQQQQQQQQQQEARTTCPAGKAPPTFVTTYEDYNVQGQFNRHTGKFQKVADHWSSKGLSDDPSIRQMGYHFDTTGLVVGPDEPDAKKPRLTHKNV